MWLNSTPFYGAFCHLSDKNSQFLEDDLENKSDPKNETSFRRAYPTKAYTTLVVLVYNIYRVILNEDPKVSGYYID